MKTSEASAACRPLPWLSDCSTSVCLTDEHPGDYGWDIAGLGSEFITLQRYHKAEMIHGRWAKLGILGCLTSELLIKYAVVQGSELSVAWIT